MPARPRNRPMLLALLAATAALVALPGCGGDDEEDVTEVLDRAFSQSIESADVSVNLDLEAQGLEELAEPVRVQLSGPYRSGPENRLPSLDWDVSLSGGGITEAPPGLGLVSTGDNIWVELGGTAYEVGEELVAQQNEALEAASGEEEQGLSALGVDPREWITDGEIQDDEEVAGVETTHVSGSIDVSKLVLDLNEAASSAQGSLGEQAPPTLTEEQLAQVNEVVGDPSFDLFVGKDDGKIRRLTTSISFEVPEDQRTAAGGLEGGSLSFSLELANVGGDQEIAAPQDARPIEDLAEQVTGLSGVLGGGGAAPDSQVPSLPTPDTGGGAGQVPDLGGGGADAEALEEYGKCLEGADPEDFEALQKCTELITPGG